MKKKLLTLFFLVGSLSADVSMQKLFEALHTNPSLKEYELELEKIHSLYEEKESLLYPKAYTFASYDIYSTPMNVTPLVPTEMAQINANAGGYPFSKNLAKVGAKLSMPLYDGSLFRTLEMMEKNIQSSSIKLRLASIAKEGSLVEFNAALSFYESLLEYLESKKNSIALTKEKIDAGVQNGRYAPAEALKLQSTLSTISNNLSDAKAKKASLINALYSLTQTPITKSVSMELQGAIAEESIAMLAFYEKELETKEDEIAVATNRLYPKLSLEMSAMRGYGESYNNGENFDRDIASLGLQLSMPLYDKSVFAARESAQINKNIAKNSLQKASLELEAEAKTAQSDLVALKEQQKELQSLKNANDKLLEIAKVAYESGRMSTEEYLRYEEALFEARFKEAEVTLKRWRKTTQIALLYGVSLSGIIK